MLWAFESPAKAQAVSQDLLRALMPKGGQQHGSRALLQGGALQGL